jgi:hypothetical protein
MPLTMRERITKLNERNEPFFNKPLHLTLSGLRGKRKTPGNLTNRDIMSTREGLLDHSQPFICYGGSAVDPTALIGSET